MTAAPGRTAAAADLERALRGVLDGEVAFDLTAAGQSVRVEPTDLVDYTLDAVSVLLVLCDRPYGETS